ncbi:hypothetical protein K0M31_011500 [Melipona bicolor]|uniref:Uncharacterized protein n=1 Tax=Melipona bicolor TaxID=60889 RepID=A0AA40GAH4_9HYME|nr:hypothetical protein K0M31_011500 [Melipona bicolor]
MNFFHGSTGAHISPSACMQLTWLSLGSSANLRRGELFGSQSPVVSSEKGGREKNSSADLNPPYLPASVLTDSSAGAPLCRGRSANERDSSSVETLRNSGKLTLTDRTLSSREQLLRIVTLGPYQAYNQTLIARNFWV